MVVHMQALAEHRGEIRDLLTRRLEAEFGILAPDDVRQCVDDVHARMAHLGVDTRPAAVERIAREHLIGMVKSQPPSGRGPVWNAPEREPADGPDGGR